jgi:uncharacterized protein with PQ loop repeat
MITKLALIAGIILPLWNIPLIVRIIKRKSSEDISRAWLFGVWICLICMFPAAVTSSEIAWKVFSIINVILFTCVVIVVVSFYKKK